MASPALRQITMLTLKPNLKKIEHAKEILEIRQRTAKRSRGKGKAAEYDLCKIFDKWYGIPQSFSRSKGSGAQFHVGQPGDIAAPLGFPLIIESKNDERWSLEDLLVPWSAKKNPSVIFKFWTQVVEASGKYHAKKADSQPRKYPVVIFTKNHQPYYIMLQNTYIESATFILPPNRIRLMAEGWGEFTICLLEDFLAFNSKSQLFRG